MFDVLSIYIVTSFVWVGLSCCITLYYPPPLPLFPVTCIIPPSLSRAFSRYFC